MPRCGCQIVTCDLPIRIDSYRGCGFGCLYCIEGLKRLGSKPPTPYEGIGSLESFIYFNSEGKQRDVNNKWCDWSIPLHWGGISDPFQPCELKYGRSLQFLRVFAESGYPVILSTKSLLLLRSKYLGLISQSNLVLQVSMTSPDLNSLEPYAPSFQDRLSMLFKIKPHVKRLIIRVQPYRHSDLDSVLKYIGVYAYAGVHGITVEGLKWNKRVGYFPDLTEWYGNSFVYPLEILIPDFEKLRNECHLHGLKFYSAENRLRYMGDSMTCCGCEEMSGFQVNESNMNHLPIIYTKKMMERGTGEVFRSLRWGNEWARHCHRLSYKDCMESIIIKERVK